MTCGKAYAVGDKVFWKRGMPSAQHALCSDEGKKMHAVIQESKSASADSDLDIPAPDGLTYLGYQIAGISYVLKRYQAGRRGALIADEMGLGKTIQAIGVINYDEEIKTVLIVGPYSLKLNWQRELAKWLTRPMSVGVANGACPESDIVIVNFDGLRKHGKELAARNWDLLVVDECHLIKNPEAQRTVNTFKVAAKAKRRLGLTGSPIPNRPKELWTILQLLDAETWDPPGKVKDKKTKAYVEVEAGKGAGFWRFATRYCNATQTRFGWDLSGASNLDELHDKLRSTCMVRRLKADVLKELPPKRRQLIEIPRSEVFDDIDEEFRQYVNIDEVERLHAEVEIARATGDQAAYVAAAQALGRAEKIGFEALSRARHALGVAKVAFAIEHVKELLDSVDKVIVFAHHHDVIDALQEGLKEYGAVHITGDTKVETRQRRIDQFQEEPDCRVFIGSIGAAGVGVTLTAASTVVFVELDWVPGNVSQAEDRAHRLGQFNSVLIQHLVIARSIDSRLTEILIQKQAIIEGTLDRPDEFTTIEREPIAKPAKKRHAFDDAAEKLTAEMIALIHRKIQFIAARCDGAASRDGAGFNANDTFIGKQLAWSKELTPRQAVLADKILVKYRRQLQLFQA